MAHYPLDVYTTVAKAHSVAADAENNHVFVPESGKGIVVFAP